MDSSALILAVTGTILILGGPMAGYFVYRYRYGQRIRLADQRDRQIKSRERKLLVSKQSTSGFSDSGSEIEDTIHLLHEEVEQKSLELSIVRQDYDLELRVAKDENDALRVELARLKGEPVNVKDVDPKEDRYSDDTFADRATESLSQEQSPVTVSDSEETDYWILGDESPEVSPRPPETPSESETDKEPALEEDVMHVYDEAISDTAPRSSDVVGRETEDETDAFEYLFPVKNALSETESETPVEEVTDDAPSLTEMPESESEEATPATGRNEKDPGAERPDRPPKSFSLKDPDDKAESTKTRIKFPSFTPVSELMGANTQVSPDTSELRKVVSLPDDQFLLLSDLGYASLSKIACLSTTEVRRLTEILKVQSSVIESEWIPNAQLILFEREK